MSRSQPHRLPRLVRAVPLPLVLVLACRAAYAAEAPDAPQAMQGVTIEAQRLKIATQSTTSSKTDTALIETPASVSVITRDQMDAQGIQSVGEALRYSAGVLASPSMAASQRYDRFDNVKIRGFDVGSNGMLRDGLRGTTVQAWPKVEPYGLEAVEVLRGPSSVLYGQNSPGGIVNQISKQPLFQPYRELQLQTGNFHRKQVQGDVSGPMGEGSDWAYRMTGLLRDSDSQFTGVPDDKVYIAPALSWRPGAATSLTLLADYTRDKFGPPAVVAPIQGTLLPNRHGRLPYNQMLNEKGLDNHRVQYSLAYLLEHRIDDVWSLHSKARYGRVNLITETIQGRLLADQRTLRRTPYFFDIDGESWSLDNNAKASWRSGGAEFETLVGLDYRHTKEDYVLNGGPAGAEIDMYQPVYLGHMLPTPERYASTVQSSDQYGLYAQQQIKLARQWVLSAGVRKDWSDTSTRDRLDGVTPPSQKDDALTWKAGAVYLAENGLAPYVSLMTSFNPVLGNDFYGKSYDPTKGKQAEVGVKYQPPGFDGFFTASVFDLRQENVQTLDPNNSLNRLQTGEIKSHGVELDALANLTRNFNVAANVTWNRLEVSKSNNINEVGKRPVGMPETMASVWGKYKLVQGPLAGLGIGLGLRYAGATKADSANRIDVPSYLLTDLALDVDLLRLSPSLRGTQLALNVTNLSNKHYYDSCSSSNCSTGDARRLLLTVKHAW